MFSMVEESTEECRGSYTSLRGCMRQQDEELERLFDLQPDQVLEYTAVARSTTSGSSGRSLCTSCHLSATTLRNLRRYQAT